MRERFWYKWRQFPAGCIHVSAWWICTYLSTTQLLGQALGVVHGGGAAGVLPAVPGHLLVKRRVGLGLLVGLVQLAAGGGSGGNANCMIGRKAGLSGLVPTRSLRLSTENDYGDREEHYHLSTLRKTPPPVCSRPENHDRAAKRGNRRRNLATCRPEIKH